MTGKAHNTQTGKSTEEALDAMGRNVKVPALNIEAAIKAARMMSRVYFDTDKTQRLAGVLKALPTADQIQRTMEAAIARDERFTALPLPPSACVRRRNGQRYSSQTHHLQKVFGTNKEQLIEAPKYFWPWPCGRC
jgi:hypothetical protein